MIGTALVEELVQSVALSHRIRGHRRVSLLLLAAPESGKTTISAAATAKHVCRVALITGRSILREMQDHPTTEFLLFNDLSAIRAMSHSAVNLLIVLLNQVTQDERGLVAFAGKDAVHITRPLGIIACLPMQTFVDHRARWRELGFVSRMVPFAYRYSAELVAEIKNSVDDGHHPKTLTTAKAMPALAKGLVTVTMNRGITRRVRAIADARALTLNQIGIRLLQNYHGLIRAHALRDKRSEVTDIDLEFLRKVDRYVSVSDCHPLDADAAT